eukprot:CAMPEP_0202977166 /NCGR_PEP_ID=MMETSP1396-20130829/83808_1 /ASSEMBLY_ACC=CAM_ASM_000872 /TAXON_ID= /ORGANISM="Pseudokeronopsis sp., Strain Brazil" /LENGTH=45 /DNA_ID= /DNA_START= /DNA_END= /DNA_ORIENTATION=
MTKILMKTATLSSHKEIEKEKTEEELGLDKMEKVMGENGEIDYAK